MAAPKVKVTYADGREVVVRVSPRAQCMTEEKFGGYEAQYRRRATFFMGWAALSCARKDPGDYETWLDQVDDVEDIVEESESVDPTQPALPIDESSS